MCIFRATVTAVSCLIVPAFMCVDLLISYALKLKDDDDDDDDDDDESISCDATTFLQIWRHFRHLWFAQLGVSV